MKISSDYPFNNRAATYGDGCFTTAAIEDGRVELLEYHLNRLKFGCEKLNLKITQAGLMSLRNTICERAVTKSCGIIKVIISAGIGGRGYQRTEALIPEAFIQVLDNVPHYEKWREKGVTLSLSPYYLSKNSSLSEIKHLNRLEQVLLRDQKLPGDDAIVCDDENMLVETFAGNIFWFAHGRWFTPELCNTGVSGVMRSLLLDVFSKHGIPVSVVRSHISSLHAASDVFICNSLMKVVRVNEIVDESGSKFLSDIKNKKLNEVLKLIKCKELIKL